VRDLKHVPGHGGSVHPAANHGDQIGGKDETQATVLENVFHASTKIVFIICYERSRELDHQRIAKIAGIAGI
jgi:hypothetical protein